MDTLNKLPNVQVVNGRWDYVLDRCRNKRVLHMGCVDTGLLEERLQRGQLMHQRMSQVAAELWGTDINVAGLETLRKHGFNHLFAADASKIGNVSELLSANFEVIVASELVEHLDNPGLFLDSLKALMQPKKTELIVTVPNAFKLNTLRGLLGRVEYVHPDHNYWFSYYTIQNIITKHGYHISEAVMYVYQQSLMKRLLWNAVKPITPYFADGIIVVAQI
jgi:2-polyprenyl-3-methyl-5-hydroxy-6-metoxy-1,4-benzoquinol methylase